MLAQELEVRFFAEQIREIHRYLEQHQEENPNHAALRWIELNAEEFRRRWECPPNSAVAANRS